MLLPSRKPVGHPANIRRAVVVQRRLIELGKEYRRKVPASERSYRRWLEFVVEREPMLYQRGVKSTEAVYLASPRD
jgi:hypothetical protein